MLCPGAGRENPNVSEETQVFFCGWVSGKIGQINPIAEEVTFSRCESDAVDSRALLESQTL